MLVLVRRLTFIPVATLEFVTSPLPPLSITRLPSQPARLNGLIPRLRAIKHLPFNHLPSRTHLPYIHSLLPQRRALEYTWVTFVFVLDCCCHIPWALGFFRRSLRPPLINVGVASNATPTQNTYELHSAASVDSSTQPPCLPHTSIQVAKLLISRNFVLAYNLHLSPSRVLVPTTVRFRVQSYSYKTCRQPGPLILA
ncbi:hypothetical protein GGS20DRAFT_382904 [Poronia punctata]|nr:hypothetical protein GGS20DRAFT_382904 [Poronia punctata]